MYVCLCKGITERQIRAAAESGADMRGLRDQLGVATECGKCACLTKEILRDSQAMAMASSGLWVAA